MRSLDSIESVYEVTGVCTREARDSGLAVAMIREAALLRFDGPAPICDASVGTTEL